MPVIVAWDPARRRKRPTPPVPPLVSGEERLSAHVYVIVGVVSGLFYREFTKVNDVSGDTQQALMHTHLLALGILGFLIVLALDKQFRLSGTRMCDAFLWFYNAGLTVTVTMMGVHAA